MDASSSVKQHESCWLSPANLLIGEEQAGGEGRLAAVGGNEALDLANELSLMLGNTLDSYQLG